MDCHSALNYIEKNAQEMEATLFKWANINSGSYHLSGLDKMHRVLSEAFACLGGEIQSHEPELFESIDLNGNISHQKTGKILTIKKRWHKKDRIILCGHMDTVFNADSSFQKVTRLENGVLNGPGVADMKGGLIVMLYALMAFESSKLSENIGWQIIINADEEIGSLGSSALLNQISKQGVLGLVYEPSMTPQGVFAGARKGSGKFSVIVEGIASHAGRNFYEGKNAICHLSSLITDIHQLNNPSSSLTINVGLVSGGAALNVVPELAIAKLDVRFETEQDKVFFTSHINKLIDKYNRFDGYKVRLHGDFSRSAKPLTSATLKLFDLLTKLGKKIDLPINWQPSGGCCDGNNLSANGLAVIDTLGVRGGNIHSDKEYMYIDSLVERAQLSVLLLLTLAQGSIKDFKNENHSSTGS